MSAFLSLPPWLILGICIAVPVGICLVVVPLVIRGRYRTDHDDDKVIGPAAAFLGTAFTLLLAFVIVNVWSAENARQEALYREFSQVEDVLLEVRAIDPGALADFHSAVNAYIDGVVALEVEKEAPAGGAPEVNASFQNLLTLVDREEVKLSADPTKAGEASGFFTEVQQLIQERESRVNSTGAELDAIFVGVMVVLGLMTILTVAILPVNTSRKAKWIQSVSVAAAVGLIISLVFYISSTAYSRNAEEGQIQRITAVIEEHAPGS